MTKGIRAFMARRRCRRTSGKHLDIRVSEHLTGLLASTHTIAPANFWHGSLRLLKHVVDARQLSPAATRLYPFVRRRRRACRDFSIHRRRSGHTAHGLPRSLSWSHARFWTIRSVHGWKGMATMTQGTTWRWVR